MFKPVILLGNGARHNPALIAYLETLNVPVLTTWQGLDLIPEDSPVYCGRPGQIGQRAANIIQQKADILLVLGVRLDFEQVAWRYDNFAPNAAKIIYDVDQAELDKLPNTWKKHRVDLTREVVSFDVTGDHAWLAWCKALYNRFRPELDGTDAGNYVNPFKFISVLSDLCTPDDVLAVGSSGQSACVFLQSFRVKRRQKVINLSAFGPMGADIPMAIGACIGSGGKRTICVTGDGGFMLNVQELEVISRLNLPIKFFVLNNNGYGSVRNMQDARFDGRHVGCDPASGFTLPKLHEIAYSYDIPMFGEDEVRKSLRDHEPTICELLIDPAFQYPKVGSTLINGVWQVDDMEDMAPKLDPAELKELMEYD